MSRPKNKRDYPLNGDDDLDQPAMCASRADITDVATNDPIPTLNIPAECRKCGEVFMVKFPKPAPATAGEWTADTVRRIEFDASDRRYDAVADAHNAALALVQRIADDSIVENVRLMNELAAEREKLATVAANRKSDFDNYEHYTSENAQLREQLAAAVEAMKWIALGGKIDRDMQELAEDALAEIGEGKHGK